MEKIKKASLRKYYTDNAEAKKASFRKYYAENVDESKASFRKHYAEYRKALSCKYSKWQYALNPKRKITDIKMSYFKTKKDRCTLKIDMPRVSQNNFCTIK